MTATVLKAPCGKCPFRSDVPIYLRAGRREDIAMKIRGGGHFPCHEHVERDDEGAALGFGGPECAGARKSIMAAGGSTQMQRIEERLGMHDPDALEAQKVPVWSLDVWPRVPEGETAETWDPEEAEGVRTCQTVNDGCLAPAGYLSGGEVVLGSVEADGECVTCEEPLCSNCADADGNCHMCTELEEEWP